MSMNRRDFGKVMLGVTGGLLAGAAARKGRIRGRKAAVDDKHICKGHNKCKGEGSCKSGDGGCAGKNSCKGKGGCASASAKHDCAGKNSCKGQGGCKAGDARLRRQELLQGQGRLQRSGRSGAHGLRARLVSCHPGRQARMAAIPFN